jgi:predicted AlkP superfamily phosphohydrolase/phosphomutase
MTMAGTLLIGLDGATFTVLDPYMERGVMPFLRDLTQQGTRAPLRTIMPPLTPPAWTSLMTGKRPGEHGVFDFFQREAPDSEFYAFTTSQDIGSATIWSLASAHGKRVVSLNFPVMFPPPDVEGEVVPGGWMPWRQLRLGCHPPGLFDRLKQLPSFDPRELALDMELEAKAIEGCPEDEYAEWIELHTRREQRWLEVLGHVLREDPDADLVAIMFDGVDKLQHLCWRFIDPAFRPADPSAWEREMIELCEGYFGRLDATLAKVVALAGDDVTVVLASDHGFGPTWDLFFVNRWLEENGYLAWKDEVAPTGEAAQIGFAQMTRHVYELDWDRTVAYAATPTSQGINVVSRAPGSDTVLPPERRDALRAKIADRLRQVRNPRTGRPLVLDVLTRDEAFPGPHRDLAPDLFLVLADGAAISILRSEELWRQREVPSGNHATHGVFVACGPDVPAGARLDGLSIADVAPLVLYSLDVPIPSDMSGRLPEAVFTPDRLARRPPALTTAAPAPSGPVVPAPALDPEEEATVVGRLRALGYVE